MPPPNSQNHVMVSPLDNCIPTYDAKTSVILGIVQMVMGSVAILFQAIVTMAYMLPE